MSSSLVLAAFASGLLTARIAVGKGYGWLRWFCGGLVLGPLGILLVVQLPVLPQAGLAPKTVSPAPRNFPWEEVIFYGLTVLHLLSRLGGER
jgi:hypothetical protein